MCHCPTPNESVHLRFLVGAAVTPAHAPSFLETGSAIAIWGMPLTRELTEQMKREEVAVLPIPRPPATLLAAQLAGHAAREDIAFQAFVSRELRRFRSEVGEPTVTVAPLQPDGIGVRFASSLLGDRTCVHRRALHAAEDIEEVAGSIIGLLRECRIEHIDVVEDVP